MKNISYPQSTPNKNLLNNPAFSVAQGNLDGNLTNSLAIPTQSLGYLGEIEWWMTSTTSGSLPTYNINSLTESVTFTGKSGVTAIYMGQRLESRDTNKLKNKTVTLSFETYNSLLTTMVWEIYRPTTYNDIHGTITTPTQTLIASGNIAINSILTRYQVSFALPSEASKGLELRFRVGGQTSGIWVMSRIQLEEGFIATDFNCDDYSTTLRKCQRYYELMQFADGVEIGIGSTATNSSPPDAKSVHFNWKTTKFSIPVVFAADAGSFTIAGSVGLSLTLSADTVGISLSLSSSGGNTGYSWTCVPVNSFVNAFLSGSSHIP